MFSFVQFAGFTVYTVVTGLETPESIDARHSVCDPQLSDYGVLADVTGVGQDGGDC